MSGLEILSKYTDDGTVELISVIAVPRSISTALGRALNETPGNSVFVNEPFNRNNRSIEVASSKIVELIRRNPNTDTPLTVITKNMATYLEQAEYEELEGVSKATIWSVRDPLVQIASLATRMANDIAVENGAAVISQAELEPYIDQVTNTLIDSDISKDFSRTGWQSIGDHFKSRDTRLKFAVVDGGQLVSNPDEVLGSACERIGLVYDSRMVSGWGSGYVNVNTGTSRYSTEENAWTSQAAKSDGIIHSSRSQIDPSILPQAFYDHLFGVALPAYQDIVEYS